MKHYSLIVLFSFLALIARPLTSSAQDTPKEPEIKVSGEVTTPIELKLNDLQKFPQTQVTRKDRDGKDHTYSGVVLSTILQVAGVTLGKDLRGENLTKYVLVEASDGYQVVFALAELDKDFTDRTIILADQVDGAPLAPG